MKVLVAEPCLTLQPHGLKPARLLCPWNSPGKDTRVGLPFPSPGDLPKPGIKPGSPSLPANSLLYEPSEKPSRNCVHYKFSLCITSNNSIKFYPCYSSMSYSFLLLPISVQFIASYLHDLICLLTDPHDLSTSLPSHPIQG